MVMRSYGATIEFTSTAKKPKIPYHLNYLGYVHLIGEEVEHRWNFVLHGFEMDKFHKSDRAYDKSWSESLTDDENQQLVNLFTLIKPDEPKSMLEGFDGAWFTLEIEKQGEEKHSFTWWMEAPKEWESVATVYSYVSELAKITYQRYLSRHSST